MICSRIGAEVTRLRVPAIRAWCREAYPLPIIFQAHCESCAFASEIFPAEYGAVFVDQPVGDGPNLTLAGWVLFGPSTGAEIAEQKDDRLVALAHPGEEYFLSQTGYTWSGLIRTGRYVRVRRVVCRECGTLYETRSLTCPPAFGCMTGLVVGLIVGVSLGVLERSFWYGYWLLFGIAWACNAVATLAAWLYIRVRFAERAKSLEEPAECPKCGSARRSKILTRRVLPCPQCGKCSMRVRSVGKA
jgi:hypothetical protein